MYINTWGLCMTHDPYAHMYITFIILLYIPIFQCMCGLIFCDECYGQIRGTMSRLSTCKNPLGRIGLRCAERLRAKYVKQVRCLQRLSSSPSCRDQGYRSQNKFSTLSCRQRTKLALAPVALVSAAGARAEAYQNASLRDSGRRQCGGRTNILSLAPR